MREGGRRRILVVDDQPTVGRAIIRMLAEHDVVAVCSGREALASIEQGARYDVILSDVVMPELSGMELHAAIGRVAPDQVPRIVFMTGGVFTRTAHAFFDHVANPTIGKPFDKAALLSVIDTFVR